MTEKLYDDCDINILINIWLTIRFQTKIEIKISVSIVSATKTDG